jgi:hypothetical protein
MAEPTHPDLTLPLNPEQEEEEEIKPMSLEDQVQVVITPSKPTRRTSSEDVQMMFRELEQSSSPPPPEIRVDTTASSGDNITGAKKKKGPVKFLLSPRASRHKRLNGFEAPYHWQQIASWVLHPLLMVLFVSLIFPWITISTSDQELSLKFKNALAAVYTTLWAVVFLLGYLATKINSEDSFVQARFISKEDFNVDAVNRMQQTICFDEHQDWCDFCVWIVHADSYHCQACNKCTDKMDHHCPIYNNCIGSKNYGYFISSLIFAFALMFLHVALDCIVIWNVANDAISNLPMHYVLFVCFHVFSILIYWIPMVYVFYLIGLFTYLNIKRTTYVDELHLKPLDATREFSRRDRSIDFNIFQRAVASSADVKTREEGSAGEHHVGKSPLSDDEKLDLVPSCTDVFSPSRQSPVQNSTTELSGIAI